MKKQFAYIRNYKVPWTAFRVWIWRQPRLISFALGFGRQRFTLNVLR